MVLETLKKEELLKKHMKKLMPFVEDVKVCNRHLSFSLTTLPSSFALYSNPFPAKVLKPWH